MADFSFLSESDDSAVEELLSEAMDQSVLEQVAAINCSGFSDSVLPTDLETRFRKLKSFPSTNANRKNQKTHLPSSNSMKIQVPKNLDLQTKTPISSSSEATAESQEQLNSSSSDGETESEKLGLKSKWKSKNGSITSSPSASSDDSSEAVSPPKQKCWLWCSPKKVSRKKSKENRLEGKDDDILSDLSIFSLKDQQKKLKKALKEEEKVAREAKKVVEWAKQASAMMNVSVTTPDVSSDDERFK